MAAMRDGDCMTSITRGGETFMFIYRDETRTEMLRQLGRMASDNETSFDWYDAAIVSERIRNSLFGPAEEDQPTKFEVRWMIRRDMPAVMEIENDRFQYPWTRDEFTETLRQTNCIGMVVTVKDEPVGYIVYRVHKKFAEILTIAVHRDFERMGAGRALIAKQISKLVPERRSRLNAIVRETNQDALSFFRGMGFKACKVLRNLYRDTDEDAYVMEYSVAEQPSKKVVGKSQKGKADDCFGV